MRKKMFAIMIIAVVVVSAGYNIYHTQKAVSLSDLALANVEALARYEFPDVEITCGSSSGQCWAAYGDCYVSWMIRYDDCRFTGYTYNSCNTPC